LLKRGAFPPFGPPQAEGSGGIFKSMSSTNNYISK
jgi:hypothetical protein